MMSEITLDELKRNALAGKSYKIPDDDILEMVREIREARREKENKAEAKDWDRKQLNDLKCDLSGIRSDLTEVQEIIEGILRANP